MKVDLDELKKQLDSNEIINIIKTLVPDLRYEETNSYLILPTICHNKNSCLLYTSRAKGLGGLNAEEAHESMFTEEYQRLDILYPNAESLSLLEDLMGTDVEPRRNFIFSNIDFSTIRE